jgi:hypothetical protein
VESTYSFALAILYLPVAGFRPLYLSNAACRTSHSQIIFTTSAIYHSFVRRQRLWKTSISAFHGRGRNCKLSGDIEPDRRDLLHHRSRSGSPRQCCGRGGERPHHQQRKGRSW